MQDSNIPTKFPIPFANSAGSGFIRPIPQASQIGIQNGAASLTDGFPPNCFAPIAGGGSWPFGQDFNGLLKQVTQWLQWMQAGGPIQWDSTFSAAIGGYPSGAVVASAATAGLFWRSTADNNTTNPDTGGAGWVPFFPGPQIQTFTTSGSFVVPAGITQVEVTTIGGGGAGGGGSSTLPGGGGGSSGVGVAIITGLTPGASIPIVVGSGGAPASAGDTGGNGGTSSFGSGPSIEATGGYGGEGGSSGSEGGEPGGTAGFSGFAGYGSYGSYGSSGNPSSGQGGTGGGPGNGIGIFGSGVNGLAALGYGGGGGGGSAGGSGSTGGAGAGGIVIVRY